MVQQISYATFGGSPAANYERYFVPAIGRPLAHDLIELADLRAGERVLDVACGTGIVARLAAERVGDGSVAAVDINPGMLAAARSAVPDPEIEWHEGSADALPLGDATFDVVLCQMGLQFFPDKPAALREMSRVLTGGGRVVLNVPGPTPPLFAVVEESLRRHVGPEAAGFIATVFSVHGTAALRRLLTEGGFTDVHARSERKTLVVPRAEDFLWQYLYSTPVAEAVDKLDDAGRADLQDEVVAASEPFVANGGLALEVEMTSAIGSVRK
jgi:ubiquinone/menaquinone biosynthesis C-methylase UbiE